jgi:Tse3 toxin immunity protein Tsi3
MSARIAVAVVALALLVVARATAQGVADPGGLRRWEFLLEGVRYHMLLPQRATATSDGDRFSVSMSERLVRQLHLRPAPGGRGQEYARVEKLSNGAILRYSIERHAGGGSGGPEAELQGILEVGTRLLAVSCLDQDEFTTPRPEWCLQFLGYLRTDRDR